MKDLTMKIKPTSKLQQNIEDKTTTEDKTNREDTALQGRYNSFEIALP
jgi:hypothetical protein